jgi:hypothetical protein
MALWEVSVSTVPSPLSLSRSSVSYKPAHSLRSFNLFLPTSLS